MDYCSLAMEQCSSYSSCVHHGPANYSCTCDPPRVWSSGGDKCILPTPPSTPAISMHVVVSVDREHYPGLLVVIHSLLKNTRAPENLHIHVVVAGEPVTVVQQLLDCHGLREEVEVTIIDNYSIKATSCTLSISSTRLRWSPSSHLTCRVWSMLFLDQRK